MSEHKNDEKVVLLVGAGSTVADVANRTSKDRPPLDKKFFSIAKRAKYLEVNDVALYMKNVYNISILEPENDSLEGIMVKLYADVNDPDIGKYALNVFRKLILLFNRRLANTTNNISPTKTRFLYRIITNFLDKGISPNNMNIITFNQDIQIEKILDRIGKTNQLKDGYEIFNFPSCYRLDEITSRDITAPTIPKKELFETRFSTDGVSIIKLHGSLNWYSSHKSFRPTSKAMFNPNRKLKITRRKIINPTMTIKGKRLQYAFPIIIPPVTHKAGILHSKMRKLWSYAGEALREADEIIIFGYSCTPADHESSNMIQRSLKGNNEYKRISIIDPDSSVLKRYVDLISPQRIKHYKHAEYFLDDI